MISFGAFYVNSLLYFFYFTHYIVSCSVSTKNVHAFCLIEMTTFCVAVVFVILALLTMFYLLNDNPGVFSIHMTRISRLRVETIVAGQQETE